jgi:RNA polymerase sigma-70 factor (ECF subfamily)
MSLTSERAAPPRPGTDVELVRRASRGDADAFDRLVGSHLAQAFRLARAIVGESGEAEDVVQEAFVSAWRGLPRLREPERFDAWFGRILVNACRMSVRRRGSVRPISIDRHQESSIASGEPELGRSDPGFEGIAASDALQRAIDRLSIDQRTILALHHLEEWPVTDVAAFLGIPVGTAKWRLHSARQALERAMENER